MAIPDYSGYGCIYLVTNLINGKRYVGQTIQRLRTRWAAHCNSSNNKCRALSAAITLYGRDNFLVEIIAVANDKDELDKLEFAMVKEHNCIAPDGYNLKHGGGSRGPLTDELKARIRLSTIASHGNPELRQKMSAFQLGSWADPESRDRRLSGILAWSNSAQAKKAKSDAAKKLWESDEFREKMKSARIENKTPRSQEYRDRMSKMFQGRKVSPETRAKMSEAAKNRARGSLSDEHKAKISEARKGAKFSEEHRAKLSLARRQYLLPVQQAV